ncbi:hypothetical protein C2845_PM03G28500 [Panicum miliaceum]|uniref:Uncharacterized protein n=1 Tax=Panicum miliaceum TaxID=4540 RepID=A0A3L6T757_PANMI|nr:hypothetical protein C2845_PM03G28500 [Panicum miliaceum]
MSRCFFLPPAPATRPSVGQEIDGHQEEEEHTRTMARPAAADGSYPRDGDPGAPASNPSCSSEIAGDPPYPARRMQTALAVSGFMFWRLAKPLEQELWGILHLSQDDEEFAVTGLPDDLNLKMSSC